MNTETRRRASAAYHAKRTAEGKRKVTIWLSEVDRVKLDAFRGMLGSKDAVISAALAAYHGPAAVVVAKAPVKAVQRAEKPPAVAYGSRLKKR